MMVSGSVVRLFLDRSSRVRFRRYPISAGIMLSSLQQICTQVAEARKRMLDESLTIPWEHMPMLVKLGSSEKGIGLS